MKRFTFLLAAMVFLGFSAYAQNLRIQGTVTNQANGKPLPGVTVMAKGYAGIGTITNDEGKYILLVPEGTERLQFSFIGMKTSEVVIGGQTTIDVKMEEDLLGLEEVVVTGLGVSREKKALGYSVQDVKGDDLAKAREQNIVNTLQGKVAGVQITNSSGAVGSSSRILIRGNNSLTGDNQPLFVVDGVPVSNAYSSLGAYGGVDYGNAAMDLNASDIENVSVLKGANAAAIYGSRAANGVILITTKKGTQKPGLGVSFESSLLVDQPAIFPDYQNLYGQGYNGVFEYVDGNGGGVMDNVDESWGPPLDGRLIPQFNSPYDPETGIRTPTPWVPNPDNVRNIFRTGYQITNNVAVTKSTESTSFRLSLTNFTHIGTLPNTDLKKNTINFSGSTFITPKFQVSATASYINNASENIPGNGYSSLNVLQQSTWFGRQVDMLDLKEKWQDIDPVSGRPYNWNHSYHDNPFWTLNKNTNSRARNRLLGSINAQYDFTDFLNVKASIGTDLYSEERMEKRAMGSNDWPKGRFSAYSDFRNEMNANILLSFNKDLSEDLNLSASAGGNLMSYYSRSQATHVAELIVPDLYSVSNANVTPTTGLNFYRKQIQSLYATASLGFQRWLYLDLTARNDWSSTLPLDNNSYFYPSVATGIIFTEALGLDSDFLSYGKVRGGWAQVGKDTGAYQLAGTFGSADPFFGNPSLSYTGTIPPLALRPETTTSLEFGTDLKFFQNRLSVDFSWYKSNTTDQIMNISVSDATGFSGKTINAGNVQNTGIELLLNARPVEKSNFSWDVTFNYADNQSTVLDLYEDLTFINLYNGSWSINIQARPGFDYGMIYGRGVIRENKTVVQDALGNDLIQYSGRPVVNPNTGLLYQTAQNVILGNVMPDFQGGLRNSLTFGNWDLSALVDFRKGGDMFSVTYWFGVYAGVLAETAAINPNGKNVRDPIEDGGGILLDGVMGTLDENGDVVFTDAAGNAVADPVTNTVYGGAQDYFEGHWGKNELGIFDASFVKLREISLGYTFEPEWLKAVGMRSANLSLVGRNLWVIYKNIPHIDPENSFSAGNVQGVESNMIPSSRSIGFNLKLTF